MNRLIIYPKDVTIITGKTERQARYLLDKIKSSLQKEKHQAVSIDEFSTYMGLQLEKVQQLIK